MKYDHGIRGTINLDELRRLVGEEYVFLDGIVVRRGTSNYSLFDMPPERILDVTEVREGPEIGDRHQDPIRDIICWPHDSDRNVHDFTFFRVDVLDLKEPKVLDVATPTYLDLLLQQPDRTFENVHGLVVNKLENSLIRKAVGEANSKGMLGYFLNPNY